jgi:2',3'-cyclic-nucleotide 2'-phosphodiesterase (5'-nucleotidase family)
MAVFFARENYDAVTLSNRETGFGLAVWKDAIKEGMPLVAANVFRDKKAKKPYFGDDHQYIITEKQGKKLGVIGFIGPNAWKSLKKDSMEVVTYRSPFEMDKLIKKVAKKVNYLTVTGEFQQNEADSLAKMHPEIDMIVSSGIRSDAAYHVGRTVIVGAIAQGANGNYAQWNPAAQDSISRFVTHSMSLDTSVPKDSVGNQIVDKINARIKDAQK